MTERSDGEPNDWNGTWKCKHRKWCALLTRHQFDAWLDKVQLYAEDVETAGSLGAPGFGFGRAPAISFFDVRGGGRYGYDGQAILSAYVTPIPIAKKPADLDSLDRQFSEEDWRRTRAAMLRLYRD
jgi:hypothetical protein